MVFISFKQCDKLKQDVKSIDGEKTLCHTAEVFSAHLSAELVTYLKLWTPQPTSRFRKLAE
jgi:hypothetical protein